MGFHKKEASLHCKGSVAVAVTTVYKHRVGLSVEVEAHQLLISLSPPPKLAYPREERRLQDYDKATLRSVFTIIRLLSGSYPFTIPKTLRQ